MPRGHALTFDQVATEFRERQAEPLFDSYAPRTMLAYRCACGNEHQVRSDAYRFRTVLLCQPCSKLQFSETRTLPVEKIAEEFAAKGAVLDSSSWKGFKKPVRFQCSTPGCSNWHSVKYGNFKHGNNSELRCSECCFKYSYLRGSDNPNYDFSLTDEHRQRTQRRPSSIRTWYRRVLENHQFTCVISGQKGGSLSAHHLYNLANYPHLALDLENGVCLTRELHLEFHRLYGRKQTTAEQFSEFAATFGIAYQVPNLVP